LFWSSFDPFFLGSCCCFWTARSLHEKRGTFGWKRGTSGPRSLRGKTRSLRTCLLKFVFGLFKCSFWDPSFALIF
jgi:hypothetical protein